MPKERRANQSRHCPACPGSQYKNIYNHIRSTHRLNSSLGFKPKTQNDKVTVLASSLKNNNLEDAVAMLDEILNSVPPTKTVKCSFCKRSCAINVSGFNKHLRIYHGFKHVLQQEPNFANPVRPELHNRSLEAETKTDQVSCSSSRFSHSLRSSTKQPNPSSFSLKAPKVTFLSPQKEKELTMTPNCLIENESPPNVFKLPTDDFDEVKTSTPILGFSTRLKSRSVIPNLRMDADVSNIMNVFENNLDTAITAINSYATDQSSELPFQTQLKTTVEENILLTSRSIKKEINSENGSNSDYRSTPQDNDCLAAVLDAIDISSPDASLDTNFEEIFQGVDMSFIDIENLSLDNFIHENQSCDQYQTPDIKMEIDRASPTSDRASPTSVKATTCCVCPNDEILNSVLHTTLNHNIVSQTKESESLSRALKENPKRAREIVEKISNSLPDAKSIQCVFCKQVIDAISFKVHLASYHKLQALIENSPQPDDSDAPQLPLLIDLTMDGDTDDDDLQILFCGVNKIDSDVQLFKQEPAETFPKAEDINDGGERLSPEMKPIISCPLKVEVDEIMPSTSSDMQNELSTVMKQETGTAKGINQQRKPRTGTQRLIDEADSFLKNALPIKRKR